MHFFSQSLIDFDLAAILLHHFVVGSARIPTSSGRQILSPFDLRQPPLQICQFGLGLFITLLVQSRYHSITSTTPLGRPFRSVPKSSAAQHFKSASSAAMRIWIKGHACSVSNIGFCCLSSWHGNKTISMSLGTCLSVTKLPLTIRRQTWFFFAQSTRSANSRASTSRSGEP